MSLIRRFLRRSFMNTNKSRKLDLRQRMMNIHIRDTEIIGGWSLVGQYVKYGPYWYNCVKSPERLWWINKEGE